jgi:Ca2+/Na+ antiporter
MSSSLAISQLIGSNVLALVAVIAAVFAVSTTGKILCVYFLHTSGDRFCTTVSQVTRLLRHHFQG